MSRTSRNIYVFLTVHSFTVGVTGIHIYGEPLEIHQKWCMSLPFISNGSGKYIYF